MQTKFVLKDSIITDELLDIIKKEYALNWDGIHGIAHWMRVYENGMFLFEHTGAKREVVELFSVLHDSKKFNDGWDVGHGRRAAKFVQSLIGKYFELPDDDFELLYTACHEHMNTLTHSDITIQTCFDSDRLDIGRIGIHIDPKYLSTNIAKQPDTMEWAYKRSIVESQVGIA